MNEIESVGPWPENSITDINRARVELMNQTRFLCSSLTAKVYLSTILEKSLDYQLGGAPISYRNFFIENDLATIHEWGSLENNVAVVRSEDHEVKIINVKMNRDKPCAFCSNEISLHREAVKLGDGRLICKECYDKTFESVLRGLKGKAKEMTE